VLVGSFVGQQDTGWLKNWATFRVYLVPWLQKNLATLPRFIFQDTQTTADISSAHWYRCLFWSCKAHLEESFVSSHYHSSKSSTESQQNSTDLYSCVIWQSNNSSRTTV